MLPILGMDEGRASLRALAGVAALGMLAMCPVLALSSELPNRIATAPSVLDPDGIPVCTATGEQLNPRVVPAADGAAIIVWLDRRRGASLSDLYAQSIAADGSVTPGWPADGRLICETGTATAPMAVPDGAGGALIVWVDKAPGPNFRLTAQRVNADGSLAGGWPASGKPLTTPELGYSDFDLELFDLYPDGSGGAYIGWKRAVSFGQASHGRVSRITADGAYASGWNSAGLLMRGANQFDHALRGQFAPNSTGGVFYGMCWTQSVLPAYLGATLARIAPTGAFTWKFDLPTHWAHYFLDDGITALVLASDDNGGCLSSWREIYWTPAATLDVGYAQHHSDTSTPLWPADSPSPAYSRAESDGEGGMFLVGNADPGLALEVHRRHGDGSLPDGWTAAGITLCTPTTLGTVRSGKFDGSLFICWSDIRTGGDSDIRACGVDNSGLIVDGWDADGTIIGGATGAQTIPAFANTSPDQLIVCWEDARTGTRDIRATRLGSSTVGVGPGPAAPTGLAIRTLSPNPARGRARVELSLPSGDEATLQLFDLAGREVRRVPGLASGAGIRSVDVDLGGLSPGVYLVRLGHAGRDVTRRIVVVD